MKSVLLSIQPKWCEKIASGKKTIEVRKTRPKIKTPFKCFIYATKGKPTFIARKNDILGLFEEPKIINGKVIGEFICDKILVRPENTIYYGEAQEEYLDLLNLACLTELEIIDYMDGNLNKPVYFWHISALKIYYNLKELGEFHKEHVDCCYVSCEYCKFHDEDVKGFCKNVLVHPPQSWCYVEELEL